VSNPQKLRGIGPRTALFLREEFPKDRAKQLANKFRVSITTAQRWLDGHAPTTAHLEAMVAAWGNRFIQSVFIEASQSGDQRIQELVQARAELIKSLGYPSDPLEAARFVDSTQARWTWIWRPSTGPDVQFSARFVGPDRVATRPPIERPKTIISILDELALEVPEPRWWQRLLDI
jgi:hypothetical protein